MTTPGTTPDAGVLVYCPLCHEAEASLRLDLQDLSWTCHECDAEFTRDEALAEAARLAAAAESWKRLLAWADGVPGRKGGA